MFMKTVTKNEFQRLSDESAVMERILPLSARSRRPTTPGAFLRCVILKELGWTQGELAARLGVSRRTISEVLTEKRRLSPDLAHRVGRLLGNGAAFWLRLQAYVDAWDALHMDTSVYQDIKPIKKVA
jgi:addiction module HigA family antidote